jgi:uncharacterized membrane protein YhaH (DUF805 family)
MFQNSFSFEGRIRRSEYGVSLIIFGIANVIITGMMGNDDPPGLRIFGFAYIPALWFHLAQGAKDLMIWAIVAGGKLYLFMAYGCFSMMVSQEQMNMVIIRKVWTTLNLGVRFFCTCHAINW